MSALATHVEEQLLDFAYGELSDADARAVQAHLSSCAKCNAQLEEIQGVRKVMARLPETDAPADGLQSLLAYADQAARRIQAGPPPKKAWWKSVVYPLAGVAAAATFFVVVKPVYEGRSLDRATRAAALQQASDESALQYAPAAGAVAPASPSPTAAAQEPAPARRDDGLHDGLMGDVRGGGAEKSRAEMTVRAPAALRVELKERPAPSKKKAGAPGPALGGEVVEDRAFDEGLGGLGTRGAGPGGGGLAKSSGAKLDAPRMSSDKAEEQPERKAVAKPRSDAIASDDALAANDAQGPAASSPAAPPPGMEQDSDRTKRRTKAEPMAAAPVAKSAPPAQAQVDDADLEEATAAPEAPIPDQPVVESGRAQKDERVARDEAAKALLGRAAAANRAGRPEDALALGRQILAMDVRTAWIRQGALGQMCEAQATLGAEVSACARLVSEYPSSGAARVARNRMGEYAAKRAHPADGPPAAAPAPRPANAGESNAD